MSDVKKNSGLRKFLRLAFSLPFWKSKNILSGRKAGKIFEPFVFHGRSVSEQKVEYCEVFNLSYSDVTFMKNDILKKMFSLMILSPSTWISDLYFLLMNNNLALKIILHLYILLKLIKNKIYIIIQI